MKIYLIIEVRELKTALFSIIQMRRTKIYNKNKMVKKYGIHLCRFSIETNQK
jgi:hypothetical protein